MTIQKKLPINKQAQVCMFSTLLLHYNTLLRQLGFGHVAFEVARLSLFGPAD